MKDQHTKGRRSDILYITTNLQTGTVSDFID